MRRNSVTIIKFFLVAILVITIGPLMMKMMPSNGDRGRGPFGTGDFLPRPPREVQPPAAVGTLHRIDWHNYTEIALLQKRTGPGEQGRAVRIDGSESKEKDKLYRVNGFNALASDKISLHRSLSDIRHPDCKSEKYLNKLPNASIIIPFHDEHWTTLLRTVQISLDRAPKHLIHEIILVDDFSTKDFLKKPLDDYVKKHYTNVKVLRAKKREGLIRTRLLGAKAATGQVLIFLDSHCEPNINFLPPLLDPIAQDRRTVVCPFIDVIDYETFQYRAQDEGARGAFDWEFFYKRLPLLQEDLKHPSKPFKSPVMAGGLFAIDASWFWELGGYDPGLDIWGGEQYELSFKIWQCGGMMLDAGCSRIGHVYRKFSPFTSSGAGDYTSRNYKRVAEVWMDEYKEYLYKRRPHWKTANAGDLTAQFEIRERLKCKSFKWFMTEIAFDLPNFYPPVEPPNFAEGEIRNLGANMCIDAKFRSSNERFSIEQCMSDKAGLSGEQQFELSWHKDIRPKRRNVCFDLSQSRDRSPVILFGCHGMQGNQFWKYNTRTQQLFHPVSRLCMDCDGGTREIFARACDSSVPTQRWKFSKVNLKEMKKLWDSSS
ncbi:putative polypeptide N-acetylgalactosaminyltransferase 10 isoform X2 [Lineus longissimus]|uniref:putative polypeptide N-acetylgalactosaminyltransferase 10 isoform X2 n=1 Tax=Lineus longissimus TaxID=88925 RepID=UPI002B4F0D48